MPCLRFIFLVIACLYGGFAAFADVSKVQVVGNGAPTRITIWSDTGQQANAFLAESGAGRSMVVPIAGANTPSAGGGTGGVDSWALSDGTLSFSFDRPMMASCRRDSGS